MKKLFLVPLLIASLNANAAALPDRFIEGLNFNKTPLSKALNQVLLNTGIAVQVDPKVNYIVTASNLSGYVSDVVNYIAIKSDISYSFDGKTLFVTEKESVLKNIEPVKVIDNQVAVKPVESVIKTGSVKVNEVASVSAKLDGVAVKPIDVNPIEINEPDKSVVADLSVKRGQLAAYSLKEYLDKQGYKLYWNASHDIEISKAANFNGDTENVIDQFLKHTGLAGWVVDGEKAIFVK